LPFVFPIQPEPSGFGAFSRTFDATLVTTPPPIAF
jgi:hypothetical protein